VHAVRVGGLFLELVATFRVRLGGSVGVGLELGLGKRFFPFILRGITTYNTNKICFNDFY